MAFLHCNNLLSTDIQPLNVVICSLRCFTEGSARKLLDRCLHVINNRYIDAMSIIDMNTACSHLIVAALLIASFFLGSEFASISRQRATRLQGAVANHGISDVMVREEIQRMRKQRNELSVMLNRLQVYRYIHFLLGQLANKYI